MTLEQIKREALTSHEQIEIMWDKLDSDPKYREEFEHAMQLVVNSVQGLEFIYNHLNSGKNIVEPSKDTNLSYDDIERAKEAVEDELFAAYQMVDVWDRYRGVQSVLNNI